MVYLGVRGRALALLFTAILCVPSLVSQISSPQSSASSGEVTLAIIVVSSQGKAERILNQLNHGQDFAKLARQESIDSTAGEGGFLGKMNLSTLRPELRDAVQGVGVGEVSPVVRTPLGYAVLKVLKAGRGAAPSTGTPATAATGSVKYVYSIGGFSEAELGLQKFDKPSDWNQDPRKICEIRKQSLAKEKASLEHFLSPANETVRDSYLPIDLLGAHFSLAELNSYEGNMDRAVEQYQEAYRIAESDVPRGMLQMDEALGIAYLHKSEMENGVYRTPGDRCLSPMHPGSAYEKKGDSQKAVEYFLKYLTIKPDELEVRWLLNLAYMTLGGYPDQVPQKYLVPPSIFASTEDVGRFTDVAPQAGLNSFSTAGGVIVDDFENNGRFDIVTSSFDSCGPMHLFHNNGDGTFAEQGAKAGLADQLGGLNIIQTDYNNDGCLDILVLRGAWELPQRKSLLRNNCDGTFTDVTAASGLAMPTSTQAAVWTDINNDGLLDLFIGNENGPAQLFLNKGDGTFEDISASAGIDRTMFTKGVAAGDYDNDGYPDLYVSNMNGYNFLYHNNHDNTFSQVSGFPGNGSTSPLGRDAGVPGSGHGFATWFFDYDNDGWPDLFVTSYYTSVDETARTYLGLPHNAVTLKLYKNMGDGTFRDVTADVGLDKVFMPMGANFGDIDNDGYLDIFLGTGNPSYGALKPSVLLRNKEGKSFVDVTTSAGVGEWHKGHGVAFADLENNGNEDIAFEVGGATLGDSHAFRLFENPGNGNDWISLKLVGVKTNRPAIGARIKVAVENKGEGIRSIYRTVSSGGSFGASPLQQHIGLGKSARIVDLEIWWPTSNTRQHFSNVGTNQFLEIREFGQNYAKLDRKAYRLGGVQRDTQAVAKQSEAIPATGK